MIHTLAEHHAIMCQALLTKIHETQQQTAVPAYGAAALRS